MTYFEEPQEPKQRPVQIERSRAEFKLQVDLVRGKHVRLEETGGVVAFAAGIKVPQDALRRRCAYGSEQLLLLLRRGYGIPRVTPAVYFLETEPWDEDNEDRYKFQNQTEWKKWDRVWSKPSQKISSGPNQKEVKEWVKVRTKSSQILSKSLNQIESKMYLKSERDGLIGFKYWFKVWENISQNWVKTEPME